MHFTFLQELNQLCPNHHNFYKINIVQQIKPKQMLIFDEWEKKRTWGKTSQGRVQNQQTQSMYNDAESGK